MYAAVRRPALELSKRYIQNLYFTAAGCFCSCDCGAVGGAAARGECRGATHDGAGVDVIRAALAVLRLQGDPGVIICNANGGSQEVFGQPRTRNLFWFLAPPLVSPALGFLQMITTK